MTVLGVGPKHVHGVGCGSERSRQTRDLDTCSLKRNSHLPTSNVELSHTYAREGWSTRSARLNWTKHLFSMGSSAASAQMQCTRLERVASSVVGTINATARG